MRTTLLFFFCLLYTSLTLAWPWPPSVHNVEGLILRRQNDNPSTSEKASPKNSQATDSSKPSSSAPPASGTDTASLTGSSQPSKSASATKGDSSGPTKTESTGSGNQSGGNRTTTAPTETDIDPRLPAGGIQMMSPAIKDPASYYKVGDQVTFAWNYTSLVVTPTAVDILVSCSANGATYTLSNNVSVQETGKVVWDTGHDAHGNDPLGTAKYTLIIHDAEKEVTAMPSSGRLGTFNSFIFGMYVPQSYTPLGDFVCATCSSALSDMERQTFKFLIGMVMITVMSFTWFAGGFGIF